MPERYRLGDLADRLGGRLSGDPDKMVSGVATLEAAGPEDVTFLTNRKYLSRAAGTKAAAILVGPGTEIAGKSLLITPEPYLSLAELLSIFHPEPEPVPGISVDARIGPDVTLGKDVRIDSFSVLQDGVRIGDRATISAGCFVGRGARIGADTVLHPRVSLYPGTVVGERCRLHSGVVLGADGFGFATSDGVHHKIPQVARVVVEDDVEIGANSTVDRGALGDTVIGRGTKIDNLVMVAHGVRIGPGSLLVAQAGIAGSTVLGEGVTLAGQSGAAGHLKLGDRCIVAAKSAVFGDLPDGAFVAGIPARDHREWKKFQAIQGRLPGMRAELRSLKEKVDRLEMLLGKQEQED